MQDTIYVMTNDSSIISHIIDNIVPFSLVALGIITLILNNRHNRKTLETLQNQHSEKIETEKDHVVRSIKPIVTSQFKYLPNEETQLTIIEYVLINSGLGPALTEKIKYDYKGECTTNLKKIFKKHLEILQHISVSRFEFWVHNNTAICKNETKPLFTIEIKTVDYESLKEKLMPLMKDTRVFFKYRDIYDNLFDFDENLVEPEDVS